MSGIKDKITGSKDKKDKVVINLELDGESLREMVKEIFGKKDCANCPHKWTYPWHPSYPLPKEGEEYPWTPWKITWNTSYGGTGHTQDPTRGMDEELNGK